MAAQEIGLLKIPCILIENIEEFRDLAIKHQGELKKSDLIHLATLRQDFAVIKSLLLQFIKGNHHPPKEKKRLRLYSVLEDFCLKRDEADEDLKVPKFFIDKYLI